MVGNSNKGNERGINDLQIKHAQKRNIHYPSRTFNGFKKYYCVR